MKILSDILNNVSLSQTSGKMDIAIENIIFDSRKVIAGSLFVATVGTQVDGHTFIAKAIDLHLSNIEC